jgi:hypothetical protein
VWCKDLQVKGKAWSACLTLSKYCRFNFNKQPEATRKICWGQETVAAAAAVKDVYAARAVLKKTPLQDGLITNAFERIRKEQLTFPTWPHTKTETR